MTCTIRILGLVRGGTTPFDGQWLVEYDPSRNGVDPQGYPMLVHLVCTPDRSKAHQFSDAGDAYACWKQTDPRHPMRADGRPNRPLTAFTVSVTNTEVEDFDL